MSIHPHTLAKAAKALSMAFGMLVSTIPFVQASSTPAPASIAVSSVNLHVRSGPGTGYRILDTLYPGEQVQVGPCRRNWCFISHPGPDGWVAARYLQNVGYRAPVPGITVFVPAPRRITHTRARDIFRLAQFQMPGNTGPDLPYRGLVFGPSFSPFPSDDGNPQTPPGVSVPFFDSPDSDDGPMPVEPEYQACFFSGNNYSGQSICVNSGRAFERLGPRWNDRISSVKVFPGAQVTLCDDPDFTGYCRTLFQSTNFLDPGLNSRISSIRVD